MDDIETERAYVALVQKLIDQTRALEHIGENDMGVLQLRLAKRFHAVTDKLRALTIELTQDAMWPHEPGLDGENLDCPSAEDVRGIMSETRPTNAN
jgi:hypothetical protein